MKPREALFAGMSSFPLLHFFSHSRTRLPVRALRSGLSKASRSLAAPIIAFLRQTAPALDAYAWPSQAMAMVFLTKEKIT